MNAAPAATRRRWPQRALRLSLWLALAWLVLANLAINLGPVQDALNRQPERFQMHWQRGLMLWPGRVILWDVAMRGQVRRHAWEIQLARASGRIALLPLLRKELRIVWLEGRQPQIAITHAATDLEPRPPSDNGLRLVFDEVRVDSPLRFVHGNLRLSGHARAQARWSQQLRRGRLELAPSQLQLTQARLDLGDQVLGEAMDLRLQAQIEPHRRAEHPGLGLLEFLSLRLEATGRGPGLALHLERSMRPSHRLLPGEGRLEAGLGLTRGQLDPGSRLAFAAPVAFSSHAGHASLGEAHLALTASDEDLDLSLSLPPIPDLVQRLEARLRLRSRALPLPPWSEQLPRVDGEIDLHSRFSSLDLVQPLLERLHGVTLDGHGEVEGRVHIEQGQLAAGTALAIRDAAFDVTAYRHRFRGSGHGEAALGAADDGTPQLAAQLTLASFDLAPDNAPQEVLGRGRDLRLEFSADGALHALRERIAMRLRFADLALPELSRFNRYLPRHAFAFLGGRGTLGADMRMRVAENDSGGRLQLAAHAASFRFSDMVLRGDLDLDARLAAADLHTRAFAVPGSRLRVRRAAILEPAEDRVDGWWATIDLREGDVALAEPMALSASAEVAMRDVAPLLSVFSRRKALPRWVTRLVDAGQARATGRFAVQEHALVLDHIDARNDRFEVLGRLRLGPQPPSGQLYARWGVLGLGLALQDGARKLHLTGARAWFEQQPAWLAPR